MKIYRSLFVTLFFAGFTATAALAQEAAVPAAAPESKPATGPKNCEVLKEEIAHKLEVKGVKNYTLTILPASEQSTLKTVGSCEVGSKKIVYERK